MTFHPGLSPSALRQHSKSYLHFFHLGWRTTLTLLEIYRPGRSPLPQNPEPLSPGDGRLTEALIAEEAAQRDKEAILRNHAHYKDQSVINATIPPSKRGGKKKEATKPNPPAEGFTFMNPPSPHIEEPPTAPPIPTSLPSGPKQPLSNVLGTSGKFKYATPVGTHTHTLQTQEAGTGGIRHRQLPQTSRTRPRTAVCWVRRRVTG